MTTDDRRIVRHLGEKVMGIDPKMEKLLANWHPLDEWSDAGELMDAALKMKIVVVMLGQVQKEKYYVRANFTESDGFLQKTVQEHQSGPRAISMAIFLATGGKLCTLKEGENAT